jgi:hypothetical protein
MKRRGLRVNAWFVVLLCFTAGGCARPPVARQNEPSQPPSPAVRYHVPPRPKPRVTTARLAIVPHVAVRAQSRPSPLVPTIYSVSATPTVARAGDTIVWKVRTSNDVTSVNASATGFTIPLQRRAPGHFGTTFEIPAMMPPFFRGTYLIGIEARNAAGIKATSRLTLRVQ